jgi:ubiquinone/menaquinone biosynthesis C-methylase UbiE
MLEKLEKILNSIDAGKVLDIASGGGEFIGFIKNMSNLKEVVAVDQLERMGEFIKKRFPEETVSFIQMNAQKLDFDDESFDTVCISNSLHHFDNPVQNLKEALRVLKTGGSLIINEMRADDLNNSQKSHDMVHRFMAGLDRRNGVTHNPTFTQNEIMHIFSEVNLIPVDQCAFSFPISDDEMPQLIERTCSVIDSQISRFKDQSDFSDLNQQAEQLKDYLNKNKYAQATSLLFLFKK